MRADGNLSPHPVGAARGSEDVHRAQAQNHGNYDRDAHQDRSGPDGSTGRAHNDDHNPQGVFVPLGHGPVAMTLSKPLGSSPGRDTSWQCRRAVVWLKNLSLLAPLSSITTPTSIVHGDQGPVCLLGHGKALASEIPEVMLHVAPGAEVKIRGRLGYSRKLLT